MRDDRERGFERGERSTMKRDDCFVVVYVFAVECDASRVARGGLELDGFQRGEATRRDQPTNANTKKMKMKE